MMYPFLNRARHRRAAGNPAEREVLRAVPDPAAQRRTVMMATRPGPGFGRPDTSMTLRHRAVPGTDGGHAGSRR